MPYAMLGHNAIPSPAYHLAALNQRHLRSHDSAQADMQEVEKEVAEEVPGKKSRKRTMREMEYCYEAELEGELLSIC